MPDVRMDAAGEPMEKGECRFCALARGELPATVVFEWREAIAFLDHRPLFPGHCLLIPRDHIQTLDDLPQRHVGPFFRIVQQLSRAVETAMGAEGTFVAINNRVSQSVPHLHVHVVPRRKGDGMRGFFWPRQKYPDASAERGVAEAIRAALAASQTSKP
ncbi:MAG TPA: HIT family protein [Candidatus Dormibacteraeota bacterium]|nr:HIT family protein [Candidatus Dormibacteraeota bacterium]